MCKICGKNCGKGGPLKTHIEGAHAPVKYDAYKICFYGGAATVLVDAWDDSVSTHSGKTVVTHVLARRFIRDGDVRRATRSERKQAA
jgi:hypothetical protein